MSSQNTSSQNTMLKKAATHLESGKLVILHDDLAKSSAYYLVAAARNISKARIAQMVNLGRSVICVSIDQKRVKELNLPNMNQKKNSKAAWNFTASVEAREGVSTGISAADRARTISVLESTQNPKLDLVMPGHIFPVQANNGGVLVKSAVPEAALDLIKLNKLGKASVFCHLLSEEGGPQKKAQVDLLSKEENIAQISISSLVEELLSQEQIIEEVSSAKLPIRDIGDFKAYVFRSKLDDSEHMALVKGDISENSEPTLVRVQSENRLCDLFGPKVNPSRKAINKALKVLEKEGGIFVYIRHRRKNLLQNQVNSLNKNSSSKTNNLRERNLRELGVGAQILSELGAKKIVFLGKTLPNVAALKAYKIEVAGHRELG